MASGDLDESKIAAIVATGAPIDAFGVGTELATSGDAPSMGAIYKLVEIKHDGEVRYTSKSSPDKHTIPGTKQLFRYPEFDLLGLHNECAGGAEAMLKPVIIGGDLVCPLPSVDQIRKRAGCALAQWPSGARRTEYSPALERLLTCMKAYFDIDTQIDFVDPAGALYGKGSERVIPAVGELNRYAGEHGIPLISSMCAHTADSQEFKVWPPHCIKGTPGQRKARGNASGRPREADHHRERRSRSVHEPGSAAASRHAANRRVLRLRRVHRVLREVRHHGPVEDRAQGVAGNARHRASFGSSGRKRHSGFRRRRRTVCMRTMALLLAVLAAAAAPPDSGLAWGDGRERRPAWYRSRSILSAARV